MRVHVCGARGSTPAPGPAFVRVGGHTSCLALAHDAGRPTLVLDAGTGLRRVTDLLHGEAFAGTILLSHLHWDHTHGLPFFASGDQARARVTLLMPEQGDALEVLARGMAPPHFPIGPDELRGEWQFSGLDEGTHEIEGFTVTAREIPHKGGRTFGYRISDPTATIAYLPDHGPLALGPGDDGWGAYHLAAMELAGGADLLFHDAQHSADELVERAGFGHSAADYAVELGRRAGAMRVMLFHHDPNRTDDQVDAMVASFVGGRVPVSAAIEGDVIHLPASR